MMEVHQVIQDLFGHSNEWTIEGNKLQYHGRTWTMVATDANITVAQPVGADVTYGTVDEFYNAMLNLRQDPQITLTWNLGQCAPVHGPEA